MSTRRKVVLFTFAALLAGTVGYVFKSFTPPIFSGSAVAALKSISVNNDPQALLIRGHQREDPVLLFLHGGPGMPAMFMAHDFQRELEKHFVVVHWDQRGAGKSFNAKTFPKTLSIETLLSDTDRVVDYLRDEFKQDKIWLLGHSHGSYLGALYAQQHADKIKALIGVGQVADMSRETAIQDAYLSRQLANLGLPTDTPITAANREELLFQTGSELHQSDSFLPILWSGMKATEYSLFDVLNVPKGSSLSSQRIVYTTPKNLIQAVSRFTIPVAMIMGAHDMTTPLPLAEEYFQSIEAPQKKWFLFEQSAHFPHFEEPEQFTQALIELKNSWQ